jgi:hypothetical protein
LPQTFKRVGLKCGEKGIHTPDYRGLNSLCFGRTKPLQKRVGGRLISQFDTLWRVLSLFSIRSERRCHEKSLL